MNEEKILKALEMISNNQAEDAKNFDGQPFNGRTVATYLGYLGAAIASLADILAVVVKEITKDDL